MMKKGRAAVIRKVISGGQTGADEGALAGALLAGVATGGTAPAGYKTERGSNMNLWNTYHLEAHESQEYWPRTLCNVLDSDGTLIIGHYESRGSRLTKNYCLEHGKPVLCVPWPTGEDEVARINEILNWINKHEIRVLNVAGNRESGNPGIQEATCHLICKLCGAANAR